MDNNLTLNVRTTKKNQNLNSFDHKIYFSSTNCNLYLHVKHKLKIYMQFKKYCKGEIK